MSKAERKPKEIEVGHAYRLYRPFSLEPSDLVGLVVEIKHSGKTTRYLRVEWLDGDEDWRTHFGYGEFRQRVHSEEPRAIQ